MLDKFLPQHATLTFIRTKKQNAWKLYSKYYISVGLFLIIFKFLIEFFFFTWKKLIKYLSSVIFYSTNLNISEDKIFRNIWLSNNEMQFTRRNCKSRVKCDFFFFFFKTRYSINAFFANCIIPFLSLSLALLYYAFYIILLLCVARDATATCQPTWINSLDLFTRCTWTTLYCRRSCGCLMIHTCVCVYKVSFI